MWKHTIGSHTGPRSNNMQPLGLVCFNDFKADPSKLHSLPLNLKTINIKSSSIEGSSSEKFPGVKFNSIITLEKHINEVCIK